MQFFAKNLLINLCHKLNQYECFISIRERGEESKAKTKIKQYK